ncbi:MAG: hypothetical protein ABSC15_05290, partial [Terriglobales bacterium]
PQPDMQNVNDPTKADSRSTGQRTRQRAYELDDQPGEGVLEALTHVGGKGDGSTGKNLRQTTTALR